jgi:hypothetical protein
MFCLCRADQAAASKQSGTSHVLIDMESPGHSRCDRIARPVAATATVIPFASGTLTSMTMT